MLGVKIGAQLLTHRFKILFWPISRSESHEVLRMRFWIARWTFGILVPKQMNNSSSCSKVNARITNACKPNDILPSDVNDARFTRRNISVKR